MGRGAEPQDDNGHNPTERSRNLGRAGRCKARLRTRAGWAWPVPHNPVSPSHRGPRECALAAHTTDASQAKPSGQRTQAGPLVPVLRT